MVDVTIKPGKILFIREILDNPQEDESVRLVGRLQYYDPKTRRVGLTHRMAQIEVDVNLVGWERLDYKLDQLYQFIGELAMEQHTSGRGVPYLRARVARHVEGMDLGLYEQSVRIRRAFLENPNSILFCPKPSVAKC